MLDLVFLVLMVVVLTKSLKGDVNILMCNIANVVGVLAAILGIITAFFSDSGGYFFFGVMNILVFVISFLIKPAANHFAKLYRDKIEEETRSYNEEVERINANFFRKQASDTAYLHEIERKEGFAQNGNAVPNPMVTNSAAFPQNGNAVPNPTVTNNVVFSPDGSVMLNPMVTNSAAFPQNGNAVPNPMVTNSAAFPQNGNAVPNPMVTNSAAFPQNGNAVPNPMVSNNAVPPQIGNAASYPEDDDTMPSISLNKPIDSGSDDNYGLPYDLSAPIDLDHGIDDISIDNKK